MNDIPHLQNDERSLALLQAASSSHRSGRHCEMVLVTASLVLAGLGFAATVVHAAAPYITVFGLVWLFLSLLIVDPAAGKEARRGATLQEEFDARLFDLPWNAVCVGSRVAEDDISRMARRYRGDVTFLRNWYPDVTGIPRPYDVILCQRANLAWDSRLRRRYAACVATAVVVWMLLGIAVGVAAHMSVVDTALRWYIPASGACALGIRIYWEQTRVAGERESARRELDRYLESPVATTPSMASVLDVARGTQDIIFNTRRQTTRVPQWVYRRFRSGDEEDMRAVVRRFREQCVGGYGGP